MPGHGPQLRLQVTDFDHRDVVAERIEVQGQKIRPLVEGLAPRGCGSTRTPPTRTTACSPATASRPSGSRLSTVPPKASAWP